MSANVTLGVSNLNQESKHEVQPFNNLEGCARDIHDWGRRGIRLDVARLKR
jgi:hypothetical protein